MFFSWIGRKEIQLNVVSRYNLIYNAALLVKEGVGYALTLDGLADTGPGSPLRFRPLYLDVSSNLDLVYRKYLPLSPIAEKFLERMRLLCHEKTKKGVDNEEWGFYILGRRKSCTR